MINLRGKFKKSNIAKTYGIYTVLFVLCVIAIYYPFYKYNKSFIWQTDGFGQHFAILYNFNETIRNLIHNFGQGLNTFSWNIGIGSDIIGEFSYYIIGDPFAYISLLFPMDKLEFAYNFLIALRLYSVGIAFLTYCKYHKNKAFNSIVGALIYTFCGFTLYAGVRHPFFLNAVLMLPIVLLGVDKILKENKYVLFILSIAITAFMNYYFLYMITILAFIYGVIKYLVEVRDRNIKNAIVKLVKAGSAYLLGILLAAVILLPTIYFFSVSNRIGDVKAVPYSLSYYSSLLGLFISNGGKYWTRICVSPLVVLLMPVALHRTIKNRNNRQNISIMINIIVELIMLLFTFCGSAMNGFSFQQNRWVFGLVFLLAYMVTLNLDPKLTFSKREKDLMLIVLLLYFNIVAIIGKVSIRYVAITFSISLIMVLIAFVANSRFGVKFKKIIPYIMCVMVVISILNYSTQLFVTKKYVSSFKTSGEAINLYNSCNGKLQYYGDTIREIANKDDGFYRISNADTNTNLNDSLVLDYKSLNQYLSIGNKYVGMLCKDLIIKNYSDTNALKKLDDRTKVTTMLANKYYIVTKKQESYVPYGYELLDTIQTQDGKLNTEVYINKKSLPIGNFYDNYIIKEDYNMLTALEKEQALIDTVVIDNEESISNYDILYNENIIDEIKEKTTKECKFDICDTDHIMKDSHTIKTKDKAKSIKMQMSDDVPQNCELYVYIDNLNFKPTGSSNKYDVKIDYGNISKKQSVADKNTSAYYTKMPGVLINLGYKEQHKGNIKITFTGNGTYTMDSIKLIAVPMDVYDNSLSKLNKTKFEVSEYNNEIIKGYIKNDDNGILQISTPYNEGWKAYVDGVETEVIKVNNAFVGIPLLKGEHEICFKYETPYLKLGGIISLISFVVFISYIIYEMKRGKGNKGRVEIVDE